MNALGHCVEALYAENRNPVITGVAVEGVAALRAGSHMVVDAPSDIDGRSRLLYGAFAAGLALGSVGMAIHHRICHVLGGTFGLAHGDANAVVLPHVVSANSAAEPGVMRTLGAALGADDPAGALFDLAHRIGARQRLDELGIEHPDLGKAADLIVARAGWNPRPARRDWIVALLEDAWIGRRPQVHKREEET
jgi:alcohol dehydrogenase class IV